MRPLARWTLLWLGALAGCSCSFGDDPPSGSVVFFAHDYRGTRLPYGVSEFRNTTTGMDLSARFRGGSEAKHIPPGSYRYVLKRSDFVNPKRSNITGFVSVQGREVLVHCLPRGVFVAIGNGQEGEIEFSEGTPIGLTGRVVGYHATADTWVEVAKTFEGERVVSRVKPDGTFWVSLSVYGSYVLSLYEDGNLVHAMAFSIPPKLTAFDLRVNVSGGGR